MPTAKSHFYSATIQWTGNKGTGTSSYQAYDRAHVIKIDQKSDILGSSDPAFRGDPTRHNPEELLVASISSCHMLWYLHLCAQAGIIVVEYSDHATGTMVESNTSGGKFEEVTLHPTVVVSAPDMMDQALALHQRANELCYIANSVSFPVHHRPNINTR